MVNVTAKNLSDYVVATNESHSVEEFLVESFEYAGLGDWKKYVEIDKKFIRPHDIDNLVGNASKAKKELGWKSTTNYHDLMKLMVDNNIQEQDRNIR